jgi:hypothetical protein
MTHLIDKKRKHVKKQKRRMKTPGGSDNPGISAENTPRKTITPTSG